MPGPGVQRMQVQAARDMMVRAVLLTMARAVRLSTALVELVLADQAVPATRVRAAERIVLASADEIGLA